MFEKPSADHLYERTEIDRLFRCPFLNEAVHKKSCLVFFVSYHTMSCIYFELESKGFPFKRFNSTKEFICMTKVYKNLNKAGENPRHSNKDPPPPRPPPPICINLFFSKGATKGGGGGEFFFFLVFGGGKQIS